MTFNNLVKLIKESTSEEYIYDVDFQEGDIMYCIGERRSYTKDYKNQQKMLWLINATDEEVEEAGWGNKSEIIKQMLVYGEIPDYRYMTKGEGGAVFKSIQDARQMAKEMRADFPNYKYYCFQLLEPYKEGDIIIDEGVPSLTSDKKFLFETKINI